MKNTNYLLTTLFAVLLTFTGIGYSQDNARTSLDWTGIYKGVVPCGSCEGINTELTLNQNLSYTLTTKYLGKGFEGQKAVTISGKFQWKGNNIVLKGIKKGERPTIYRVEENRVRQLDLKGKVIKGNLADKYVLNKIQIEDMNKFEVWFVADKTVDCTGIAPQKCLLVKEENSSNWQYFYDSIDGFKFKENYTQKIQVKISPKTDVPVNASASNFQLVKVLSSSKTDGNTKEEALSNLNGGKSNSIEGKTWQLVELYGKKVIGKPDTHFISFDAKEKRVSAKAGCNNFGSSYKLNNTQISFGNWFSNTMGCPEGSIEDEFARMLQIVDTAIVSQDGKSLTLHKSRTAAFATFKLVK